MLIRYLIDMSIAYDGINIVHENKGNKVDVKDTLAKILTSSGRAEMVQSVSETIKEDKKVETYNNKKVKSYENKSVKRGRPQKVKK